jgi:hypothetical protein
MSKLQSEIEKIQFWLHLDYTEGANEEHDKAVVAYNVALAEVVRVEGQNIRLESEMNNQIAFLLTFEQQLKSASRLLNYKYLNNLASRMQRTLSGKVVK